MESRCQQAFATCILIHTCSLRYSVMCDSKTSAAAAVIDGVHESPFLADALFAACSRAYFHGVYINSETIKTK